MDPKGNIFGLTSILQVLLSQLLYLRSYGGKGKGRGGGRVSPSRSQKTNTPGLDGLETDELNNLQDESSSQMKMSLR